MYYLKLILIFIVFFNVSCTQEIQKNGISMLKVNEINIETGKTSRNNLINKYGPPAFESIFNNNTIYYVSHVSSYKNLDKRKTIELIVFEITLDKKNIVQEVKKYNEKDAVNIQISNKKTIDNNDMSKTFFKDILNNLRRRNVDN